MMTTAQRYPKVPITEIPDTNGGKPWLMSKEDPKNREAVNIPKMMRSAITSKRSCSCFIFSLPD
jgi:hypothetical protein